MAAQAVVRALEEDSAPFHKYVHATNMHEAPILCQAQGNMWIRHGQVSREGAHHLRVQTVKELDNIEESTEGFLGVQGGLR